MAPRRRLVSLLRTLAVAALVGLVLGVLTQLGQSLLPAPLRPIANSISPWLAVAFAVGSRAPRPVIAALSGFVALALALIGYYSMVWIRFGYGPSNSSLVVWGIAAIAGGLVFGPGGWLWRKGSGWLSAVPVGLLAAAFIADGVYIYNVVQPDEKAAAVLYVIAGALTPAIMGESRDQRAVAYISVLPALGLAAFGYLVFNVLIVSAPV